MAEVLRAAVRSQGLGLMAAFNGSPAMLVALRGTTDVDSGIALGVRMLGPFATEAGRSVEPTDVCVAVV